MTTQLYNSTVASRFFPEIGVTGFSHVDGTVIFYNYVQALLKPHHVVLEFGAGRGEHIVDDPVEHRRNLSKLKDRVSRVIGYDVDPVVRSNPFIDEAHVGEPGSTLPFADDTFDVIVSRYVFEHVDDAGQVAGELMRVLKPGGVLCAVTPNKFGYVALVASMVPNKLHARVMRKVQPGREGADVFPTRYKLNSVGDVKRVFGPFGSVAVYRASGEPAYYFGSPILYGFFLLVHRLLPARFATAMHIFVRKTERDRP